MLPSHLLLLPESRFRPPMRDEDVYLAVFVELARLLRAGWIDFVVDPGSREPMAPRIPSRSRISAEIERLEQGRQAPDGSPDRHLRTVVFRVVLRVDGPSDRVAASRCDRAFAALVNLLNDDGRPLGGFCPGWLFAAAEDFDDNRRSPEYRRAIRMRASYSVPADLGLRTSR